MKHLQEASLNIKRSVLELIRVALEHRNKDYYKDFVNVNQEDDDYWRRAIIYSLIKVAIEDEMSYKEVKRIYLKTYEKVYTLEDVELAREIIKKYKGE